MSTQEIQGNIADAQTVRIRTFGAVKIESPFGCYEETHKSRGNGLLLLKYLLVNHNRMIGTAELMKFLWPNEPQDSDVVKSCVSWLRTALSSLQLTGKNGLLASTYGNYGFNPKHTLQIDSVRFEQITKQLHDVALSDPEGLKLCEEALELYQGHYLERTEELPWLTVQRKEYYEAFYFVVNSALSRMENLNDIGLFPLLHQRVTALVPSADAIHSKLTAVLTRYKLAHFKDEGDASFLSEFDVHVRLFGPLEVANRYDRVEESSVRASHSLLLFKYLLINKGVEASQTHLMEMFWPDELNNEKGDGALRTRLSRLRAALKPLHLDGKTGLVSYSDGKYSLNSDYDIHTDEELISYLIAKIETTRRDDPQGLRFCADALELFRGRFLEGTAPHPWVDGLQADYHKKFCRLVESTLSRMKALNDTSVLPLLCRRMLQVAPEETVLHIEIIYIMVEKRLISELVQYISKLSRFVGEGFEWLEPNALPPEEPFIFRSVNEIRVRLFGPVELENQFGRALEQKETYRWLYLKYLLVNNGRTITEEEFQQKVWQHVGNTDSDWSLPQLFRRQREALAPLNLGPHGLILYQADCYTLNANYRLITDVDILKAKQEAIRGTALEDPAGLQLCLDAIDLFRGPFMEYTREVEWLAELRDRYNGEFSTLVQETLDRMQAVGTNQGISLLWQRAVAYAPENKDLHMKILAYMVEQNLTTELIAYACRLVRSNDKSNWINNL